MGGEVQTAGAARQREPVNQDGVKKLSRRRKVLPECQVGPLTVKRFGERIHVPTNVAVKRRARKYESNGQRGLAKKNGINLSIRIIVNKGLTKETGHFVIVTHLD
ncbi:uncharacterized protein LOC128887675 [Hylaeus anthracinus]|uniref:uncharacterized protein LOC128887675 n=1 Tax=Hylaeus anthracinus TaxID=313031 RepID=UPI0023B9C40C|nr:uncharacterized protein LOC128887675 [Hylaeus anthracinus]